MAQSKTNKKTTPGPNPMAKPTEPGFSPPVPDNELVRLRRRRKGLQNKHAELELRARVAVEEAGIELLEEVYKGRQPTPEQKARGEIMALIYCAFFSSHSTARAKACERIGQIWIAPSEANRRARVLSEAKQGEIAHAMGIAIEDI